MRDERAVPEGQAHRMVRGGCNSLMNYPQTHQLEGKEETGQRRKAVLIGRVVKIDERMRVEVREVPIRGGYSRWPSGRIIKMPEDSGSACEFPAQAENAVTEILSLRPEVSPVAQQEGVGDHQRKLGNERLIPENRTMVHRNGHASLISKWPLFASPYTNICHFRTWRNVAE